MTILSEPATAGHWPKSFLTPIRTMINRWTEDQAQRTAERQTAVLLRSLDRRMLADIGATDYLAEKEEQAKGPGQSVIAPLLSTFLPN
jgi:hypothetical protein